ncbi:MAG: hypothetical protein N2171_04615 [Clostridia bacterium]|nr:hypothetical protein [Clostridia bacterium]
MINEENIKKAVCAISEKTFAQLIYMLEYEEGVNLIFVSNNLFDEKTIKNIEIEASGILECEVEVLDMREFDEADRIEIIRRANLIYCKNTLEKKIFEMETVAAYRELVEQRKSFMERKQECATFYLQ